ncbi:MAG: uncharacterized protein JWQ55_4043 [Rhodopila sp.]|jgi:hypothetical protein|nr:uncharacterized protein [Rhodopila sp.]
MPTIETILRVRLSAAPRHQPDWIATGLSWRGAACYPTVMLEPAKVNDVVKKAAFAVLKRRAGLRRVFSEPTSDSQGHEALHITIVLEPGGADKISGDMALDTLVGVERALRGASEDRLPIIDFATEDELESSGETES